MSNLCSYVVAAFDEWAEANKDKFEEGRKYKFVELINEARDAEAVNGGYLFARALDVFNIDPSVEDNVWNSIIKEAEPAKEDKWNWVLQLQSQGDLLVTQDIIRATRDATKLLKDDPDQEAAKIYIENVYDTPVVNGVFAVLNIKDTIDSLTKPTSQVQGTIACDLDIIRKEGGQGTTDEHKE